VTLAAHTPGPGIAPRATGPVPSFPLGAVASGAVASRAWGSGEERAVIAGALVMVLTLMLVLFGAGGGLDGGLLDY
jgi:hypothetical protein